MQKFKFGEVFCDPQGAKRYNVGRITHQYLIKRNRKTSLVSEISLKNDFCKKKLLSFERILWIMIKIQMYNLFSLFHHLVLLAFFVSLFPKFRRIFYSFQCVTLYVSQTATGLSQVTFKRLYRAV